MKYQVYVKKEIKSEADLPKEPGFYFVNWTQGHAHNTTMASQYYDETIKGLWFGKGWFDWYLQPIELDLPDDVFDKINCLTGYLERWLNNPMSVPPFELKDVIEEANIWLKDKIKN